MSNFDDMKLAVEALSGGKNTVLFDDLGLPSIMVRIPLFKSLDVMAGGDDAAHPMFVVSSVQRPEVMVSKYQNIVMYDRAYSLPYKDPKTSVNFDQSKLFSENKGLGWHLMTNAEWAGIALWCKKNGFMPRGNNNYGADHSAPHEKGVETHKADETRTGRVATGSGPASWAHDNTNEGIFDLNGNVWEWVGGLRLNNGEIQIIPNNDAANAVDQSATSPLWKAMLQDGSLVAPGTANTLKVDNTTAGDSTTTSHDVGGDPRINTAIENPMYIPGGQFDYGYSYTTYETLAAKAGVTIPNLLKALGMFPVDSAHGADGFYTRNYGERLPIRGGDWGYASIAGVFSVDLRLSRAFAGTAIGFRSAFVVL
ncbi:MAG: SUMF1/EgtB/PvdO family nonheme iron enzyme [Firmicutes bacterium]|nr:SUMF1/EgtB/PvdO family nonheme iron enzyme [Bacillota bacterium]